MQVIGFQPTIIMLPALSRMRASTGANPKGRMAMTPHNYHTLSKKLRAVRASAVRGLLSRTAKQTNLEVPKDLATGGACHTHEAQQAQAVGHRCCSHVGDRPGRSGRRRRRGAAGRT